MGSAVLALQRQFLLDWQFASDEKVDFDDKYFPQYPPQGKTGIQIVSSGPDSEWPSIKYGYFKIINLARKYIYIQTPYLVPDESILQSLKVAALAGVDVRVMIPCKPDQFFVHWASHSYVGELIKTGVKCYKYNKGFLHGKMVIADGIIGSVGSANLDMRSFGLNFEVNAFLYDKDVIYELERIFENDLKECTEITQEIYNQRAMIVKCKESISRLFSPIL